MAAYESTRGVASIQAIYELNGPDARNHFGIERGTVGVGAGARGPGDAGFEVGAM
jgi:hypothetical protein